MAQYKIKMYFIPTFLVDSHFLGISRALCPLLQDKILADERAVPLEPLWYLQLVVISQQLPHWSGSGPAATQGKVPLSA